MLFDSRTCSVLSTGVLTELFPAQRNAPEVQGALLMRANLFIITLRTIQCSYNTNRLFQYMYNV